MKQTAVEYLEKAIDKYVAYIEGNPDAKIFTSSNLYLTVEQAKELDKQQKMDAWNDGNCNTDLKGYPSANYAISAEHYYNQKYGGEK